MVKIRYSELPAGLHVAAAADREGTVVYLQPGLTSAQRRAALTRVRSSARIGQGPTLPAPAMARAIAADRVRTNASIGAAAARRHPMLFLPPALVLLVSAVAILIMSIQPLKVATQGNVRAAAPPNSIAGPLLPVPGHQRTHRAGAPAPVHPSRIQRAGTASCAAPLSRQALPAPPTRATSSPPRRCLTHPQRLVRSYRL